MVCGDTCSTRGHDIVHDQGTFSGTRVVDCRCGRCLTSAKPNTRPDHAIGGHIPVTSLADTAIPRGGNTDEKSCQTMRFHGCHRTPSGFVLPLVVQRKQRRLHQPRRPGPPRCIHRQTARGLPRDRVQRRQEGLRRGVTGGDEAGVPDRTDVPLVRRERDGVLREGVGAGSVPARRFPRRAPLASARRGRWAAAARTPVAAATLRTGATAPSPRSLPAGIV